MHACYHVYQVWPALLGLGFESYIQYHRIVGRVTIILTVCVCVRAPTRLLVCLDS